MMESRRTLELGIDKGLAEAELSRVLADPRFRLSDRNRAFLRHVAEALFTGQAQQIKAYSIAVDVFGRPAEFDPGLDPIVRIEATRLRAALEQYYDLAGSPLGARIDLPRGSYIPVFSLVAPSVADTSPLLAPATPAETVAPAPTTPAPTPRPDAAPPADAPGGVVPRRTFRRWMAAGAMAVIVTGTAIAAFRGAPLSSPYVEKPVVEFLAEDRQPFSPVLQEVLGDVLIAVGHFAAIRPQLHLPDAQGPNDRRPGEGADYLVTFALSETGDVLRWRITSPGSREVLLARQSPLPPGGRLSDLAADVARRIAGHDGVINLFELRRTLPGDALGNVCYLRAEMAVQDRDLLAMTAARGCLEATLAARPDDVDAHAGLARIEIWDGRMTNDRPAFARALAHAARAFRLQPSSIRAGVALMAAQYHMGQHENAIATGRYLASLNPENNLLLAEVGLLTFVSGDSAGGVAMARQADELSDRTPRDAGSVRMLEAFLRGDYPAAVAATTGVTMDDVTVATIRLLAIGMMKDTAETEAALASARLRYPDLPRVARAIRAGNWGRPDLTRALHRAVDNLGLDPAP